MDPSLQEICTHIITDHYKNPRNARILEHPTHVFQGENPLCGDQISLSLRVEEEVISEIGFQAQGCALSTASASILTVTLAGRRVSEVREIYELVNRMLKGGQESASAGEPTDLMALTLASSNPSRIACVMLSWDLVGKEDLSLVR